MKKIISTIALILILLCVFSINKSRLGSENIKKTSKKKIEEINKPPITNDLLLTHQGMRFILE